MTDTQFAALSALLIDLNGFLERSADALERISDALESQDTGQTSNALKSNARPQEIDVSFPEADNAPGDVLVDPWPKRKAPADPWT